MHRSHFQLLTEAVSEFLSEEGSKSLATFQGLGSAEFPDELRPSGKPNAEEKARAEHAYATLRGSYRKKMSACISSYLKKTRGYRESIDDVADIMDDAFLRAYIYGMRAQSGRKGVDSKFDLADAHYRWILAAAEEELGYFEQFMKDVRYRRDLRPDKMSWEDRVDLYAKTLDSIFDAGRMAGLAQADNVVVYWIVDPEAESCRGCLMLEEESPFLVDNIPCTPRDGATECLSNCKCSLLVKRVSPEDYARIEFSQTPKDVLLYQLTLLKGLKIGTNRTKRR